LSELKIDANGGHRESREKIQAIHDLLDNAIEKHGLRPVDMMLAAKVFADAGWIVPESLKRAVAEAFRAGAPDAERAAGDDESFGGDDIVSSLLEAADEIAQNPFDSWSSEFSHRRPSVRGKHHVAVHPHRRKKR